MECDLVIDGAKRQTAQYMDVKNPSTFEVAGPTRPSVA
jgi:hypothetical protein